MRVLVLSYETPSYPGAGGPSRLHALLSPLASRHEIRVVSTGGRPPFGSPPEDVDIRLVEPGPPAAAPDEPWLRKNVAHYVRGGPWLYVLARHHVDAIRGVLPEELAAFGPDLVVVEHEEMIPLLDDIPRRTPTVLDLHNLLVEVAWQNRRAGSRFERAKAMLELGVLAREERRGMSRATRTIVVSRPNLRLARRLHPRAHIELIQNPVRTDYFRRVFPRSDHPVVVMTASYHYPPNHEAAVHLVRAIFPQVRARVADVELRLVGQRMPEDLAALASATPGVTVVGKVDDVRPELDRAWVAVAPMTKGSGSPLKVLEALSMGVPVVTTSRVATSLELAEREGLVTADTPGAFAETVAELLTREERRDLLGAAGARAVPERFGHERLAAKLERVWTEAMTERSPG